MSERRDALLALRTAIQEQLAITGTACPWVRLSPEHWATYELVRSDSTFQRWLRVEARDQGRFLVPEIEPIR